MEFYGDYHMHTNYSDGRGTVEEMVIAGYNNKLKELGITDHGPHNIGTGVKNEKKYLEIKGILKEIKPKYRGIKLLVGAETNVINLKGEIDISKEIIKQLDYLLIGLHPYIIPAGAEAVCWIMANHGIRGKNRGGKWVKNMNTKALVNAVNKNNALAISHPGLKMSIDIQEVARACVNKNTAWEINTGHKYPPLHEVKEAYSYGVDFIVNSDAHYPESVGCLDYGSWILEKLEVPEERIRNYKKHNMEE